MKKFSLSCFTAKLTGNLRKLEFDLNFYGKPLMTKKPLVPIWLKKSLASKISIILVIGSSILLGGIGTF